MMATLVPVVVSVVFRRGFVWSVSASCAVYLAFTFAVVVEPAGSLTAFIDGYTAALQRLLTSTPPLLASGGNLVPLVTVVWIAATASAEMTMRTRTVGGLLVGPVVLVLVAHAIAVRPSTAQPSTASELWLALALVATLAMLVVFRHQSLETEQSTAMSASERRATLTIPVLAVLLILLSGSMVALFATRLAGDSTQASLEQSPAVETPRIETPLELVAALRDQRTELRKRLGDGPLFKVKTKVESSGYFTLSALSVFDGATWVPPDDASFDPTGLEVVGGAGSGRVDVLQTYLVLADLPDDLRWLPALERPLEVSFRSDGDPPPLVLVDSDSGTLRSPGPLTAGSKFEVTSRELPQNLADLNVETDISGRIPAPFEARTLAPVQRTRADTWRTAIDQLPAEKGGGTLEPSVPGLIALERYFRGRPALDESAPARPSLSLGVLDTVFNEGQAASPEQLASQFVLVTRSMGLPARIVTGFRLGAASGDNGRLPAGEYQLAPDDLWTWAEVFIGDLGWVRVDPAGAEVPGPPPPPSGGSNAAEDVPLREGTDLVLPGAPTLDEPSRTAWWQVAAAALVGLGLVVGAVFVAGRRPRRRARRRRGDPLTSVTGAWLETLDVLDEARLGSLESAGASEVTSAASDRFGDGVAQPVADVAVLADPAVFSSRPFTADDAGRAWDALDRTRRALRTRLTVRQRLGGMVRALRPQRRPERRP
jgi:hypothetical protein